MLREAGDEGFCARVVWVAFLGDDQVAESAEDCFGGADSDVMLGQQGDGGECLCGTAAIASEWLGWVEEKVMVGTRDLAVAKEGVMGTMPVTLPG